VGAKDFNPALKCGIDKAAYKSYWHRLARETTVEYFEAVRALNAQKIWCPAERDEERLTKYLNHPERLTQDEHIRLPMYAKELQLIPKRRISRYRKEAYRMYGKARAKWAWRKAILKPPLRDDGLPPPPHRTMNDLLPPALKEYQRLCQDGKEPPATKEELFALFRRRLTYTREEVTELLYPGEEVDWRHCCHGRRDGRSMPWDWFSANEIEDLPPDMTLVFLGEKARVPYAIRKRRPPIPEQPEFE
jgi:hypothetical protein